MDRPQSPDGLPGDVDLAVVLVGDNGAFRACALPVGEPVLPGAQDVRIPALSV